jgi:2-(1,2-epoxy-1,2-dihydrophenyl)acetyl-CoA isomerase
MTSEKILFHKQDGIARITLNMPEKRNALPLDVRLTLLEMLKQARDDDDIRTVVLTGSGKAFCAGGDISTMEGVTSVAWRKRLKKGQLLVRTMYEMEKPIIAAVNGVAAGAGVSLALASDFIIASEKAKFILSFIKIGITPDWGQTYFLPLRIGVIRAKELMMTGDPIDAAEAERIGMINRVVPQENFEQEVSALAKRLAQGPSQAYAMIKLSLNRFPMSLESALELESAMVGVCNTSQDADEGRRAFLEKRQPVFQGK